MCEIKSAAYLHIRCTTTREVGWEVLELFEALNRAPCIADVMSLGWTGFLKWTGVWCFSPEILLFIYYQTLWMLIEWFTHSSFYCMDPFCDSRCLDFDRILQILQKLILAITITNTCQVFLLSSEENVVFKQAFLVWSRGTAYVEVLIRGSSVALNWLIKSRS